MAPLSDTFKMAELAPGFESRKSIHFLHPQYKSPGNISLVLPCADRSADGFGIYHNAALVARQIIAKNAFETGRLALDVKGEQIVMLPLDDILTNDE